MEQKANRLLELLYELPAAAFVANGDLKIIFSNGSFADLFEVSDKEVFGQELTAFLETSATITREFLETVGAMTDHQHHEALLAMRFGNRPQLMCTLSVKKREIGGQSYLLGVIHDVTDIKKAETNLKVRSDRNEKHNDELKTAFSIIENQNRQLKKHNQYMTREMQIASSIQQAILPKNLPTLPGAQLYGQCRQINGVGGDYFDILPVDRNKVALVVADVSGHGVAASLLTTMLKVYLENGILQTADPGEILLLVNGQLCRFIQGTGLFISAILMIADTEKRRLSFSSVGHQSYLCLTGDGRFRQLDGDRVSPVLGLDKKTRYQSSSFGLEPGDHLFLFTDGLTEARNPDGRFWGDEGLKAAIVRSAALPAEVSNQSIFADLETFCEGAPANDDRTLLNLKIL